MKYAAYFFLFSLTSAICADIVAPEQSFKTKPITIGEAHFNSEIADTDTTRARGLMGRTQLADNQAMTFIFKQAQSVTFWMKNTLIPLDMLFFDNEGTLLEIKSNVQPCSEHGKHNKHGENDDGKESRTDTEKCPLYPSKSDNIRYVVEIAANNAKRQGIEIGDKLQYASNTDDTDITNTQNTSEPNQ